MDIRMYYRNIREAEAKIATPDTFVVSKATPDGGREGVLTEVSRERAATLIVDGRARLATDAEVALYRTEITERLRKSEEEAMAKQVQFAVISDGEMQSLKNAKRPSKS